MPRDVSGNYTLPAGNPVVNDTLIDVTWANPTLSDIATQLNNVVTRDGVLNPTASIKFFAGSAAAPGVSFAADTMLGIYRVTGNTLGFSSAGVLRASVNGLGNWAFIAAASGPTLSIPDITVTGTSTLQNVNVLAGTTFAGTNITWSGNPVHSGNHTFSGTVSGPTPSLSAELATKNYVDSVAVSSYDQATSGIAVYNYLNLL